MPVLDVRKLRLLRELKVRGTVTGVAAALSYRPSSGSHSGSQQLAALEKEVGAVLLERAGRRLQFIPQGELLAERTWAVQLCRAAGFEPDVRFETADLVAHICLVASGNAAGLLPDLVWAGEKPSVRLLPLPGSPHRTVFTSARRSAVDTPGVVTCRRALAAAGPRRHARLSPRLGA